MMTKFTLSTKPFSSALDLAVLKSISDNDSIGILAQLTVDGPELRVNFQYPRILTELRFKGMPSDDKAAATVFVKNTVLNQLVATLESNTVDIEFTDGGIVIRSGKSNFSIPKLTDETEMSLNRPDVDSYKENAHKLDTAAWKFVKDNLTHVLVSCFENPVYNYVWVSEAGDTLSGDISDSLFAHAIKSDLKQTCLLSTTAIDILSIIPDNATIKQKDTDYLINVKGEGYEYITELKPQHESDPDTGDYNSAIILGVMKNPENYLSVNPEAVRKVLNQAALLSTVSDDVIEITLSSECMVLKNNNVDCNIEGKINGQLDTRSCSFTTKHIKQLLKPFSGQSVNIGMLVNEEDATVGIILFDGIVTMVVGGVA